MANVAEPSNLRDYVGSSEESSPAMSSRASPVLQGISSANCTLCQAPFSVTRLKHSCRICHSSVCSSCSKQRLRIEVGEDKVRLCDDCAKEWRSTHAQQLEETVDVRVEINNSLKALLKEKFDEIEGHKKFLVELMESHAYLKEPPSINGPTRFSSEMGLARINFVQLVKYMDERISFLKQRKSEVTEAVEAESRQQSERRTNFGFLQDRTLKAESDAKRAAELTLQRDRLRETFREQAARIRAMGDRVEILESEAHLRGYESVAESDFDPDGGEFVGDRLVDSLMPCLRLSD